MATQTGSFGSSDGRGRILKDSAVIAAMVGAVGVLGTAAINVIPNLVNPPAQASSVPNEIEWSPYGQVQHVTPDGPEIAVAGLAAENVEGLVVGIGPRPNGQYWTAPATVTDGEWTAVVATDSGLPADYKMKVWYKTRASAARGTGVIFRLQPPPPPPPSPNDIAACAAEHGDACFTQPGWQSPSVYQGN